MSNFKLVGVMNGMYAIQDTDDLNTPTMGIDVLSKDEVLYCLGALNVEIAGVVPSTTSRDFSYVEDYFFPVAQEEEGEVESYADSEQEQETEFEDFDDADDEDEDEDSISDDEDEDNISDADEDTSEQGSPASSEAESEDAWDDYDDEEYGFGAYDGEDQGAVTEDADSALVDSTSSLNPDEEVVEDDEDYGDWSDYDDDDDEDLAAGLSNDDTRFMEELKEALDNSNEKLALLSNYYMYNSNIIFNNSSDSEGFKYTQKSSKTLTPRQLRKKEKLEELRGTGTAWVYGGFVDTGYLGGGTCTLGHNLRYHHLALDASQIDMSKFFQATTSLNEDGESVDAQVSYNINLVETLSNQGKLIKFGIDCLSDFFEVDKATVARLKSMQQDAVNEMHKFIYIHQQDMHRSARDAFKFFEEIMDEVVRRDTRFRLAGADTILSEGDEAFYLKFKQNDMIYPRSLVRRARYCLSGILEDNFSMKAFKESPRSVGIDVKKVAGWMKNIKGLKELAKVESEMNMSNDWAYILSSRGFVPTRAWTIHMHVLNKAFYNDFMGFWQLNTENGSEDPLYDNGDGGRSDTAREFREIRNLNWVTTKSRAVDSRISLSASARSRVVPWDALPYLFPSSPVQGKDPTDDGSASVKMWMLASDVAPMSLSLLRTWNRLYVALSKLTPANITGIEDCNSLSSFTVVATRGSKDNAEDQTYRVKAGVHAGWDGHCGKVYDLLHFPNEIKRESDGIVPSDKDLTPLIFFLSKWKFRDDVQQSLGLSETCTLEEVAVAMENLLPMAQACFKRFVDWATQTAQSFCDVENKRLEEEARDKAKAADNLERSIDKDAAAIDELQKQNEIDYQKQQAEILLEFQAVYSPDKQKEAYTKWSVDVPKCGVSKAVGNLSAVEVTALVTYFSTDSAYDAVFKNCHNGLALNILQTMTKYHKIEPSKAQEYRLREAARAVGEKACQINSISVPASKIQGGKP